MGSKNGKPVLRPEDAQSLAKTSGLSEEEVKAKFEKFQEEHPKGKMGKRSFRTMMSQALPKHKISKLEAHVFRIYDTNNDGQIDFVEFMIVYYCLSEGTPDQVVRKLFRVFDVNSDGSISYPEMKRLVKDLYGLLEVAQVPGGGAKDTIAKSAFEEMDFDKNGLVSQQEFVDAVLGRQEFAKMLTNGVMSIFVGEEEQ